MKLVHISDLHLGKRVNEFSMLEEQKYILEKIIEIISDELPNALVIAGDIYDKAVPSAEAVQLFDSFLVSVSSLNVPVFAISGNHDSAERIAFGSRLMKLSGVYLSPVYNGAAEPVELQDDLGSVFIYMLPFIKPSTARGFFPNMEIESYDDAVRTAVKQMNIDLSKRNVIIAHQFVTGAERCESESISVGGLDDVGADIFAQFDYAALGHIHGSQRILSDTIRYCGTPLKYSFSEIRHNKSVTVVTMRAKGDVDIDTIPLVPLHNMREIKGSYMEVTSRSFYTEKNRNDYLHVTLTDEQDVPEAIGKLRVIYPNIMTLDYDNTRTRSQTELTICDDTNFKPPIQLFGEFYEQCNNAPMSEEQSSYISKLIEELWE